MDYIKNFTVTKGTGSEVTITGEIPFEEVEKHRSAALKKLGANVKLDGFREGHVPEDVLVRTVGDGALMAEMAERALARAYPAVVKEHTLDVVGHPQIQITKLAPDNPLGFTATVAVLPEITLPDVKQVAKETNLGKAATEVTDEEVETQVKDILRQKLAYERLQKKAAAKKNDDGTVDLPTPETHTHADGTVHEGPAHDDPAEEVKAVTDDELPELTDEYVKELGQPGQFETVADFKSKLKEHLQIEKEREVKAAHRALITDKIIEESAFEVPKVMIDAELNQMFAQMNEDLTRANLKIDDYLTHIKKTKEDLENEWRPAAEKRARLQLILNEIAKKEDIKPDQAAVEQEVENLLEQYKDADETRVRTYVASVLQNEAVMQMLESQ
ncbi:MAG: trigger factor [Candidatus Paceibacterota bacterium]